MARHRHVIHLSEVPVDNINAPAGSLFGGQPQRVGGHIGAEKLGYSFFVVPPARRRFITTRTRAMKR